MNDLTESVNNKLTEIVSVLSEGPEWPPPCAVELVFTPLEEDIFESAEFENLSLLSDYMISEVKELIDELQEIVSEESGKNWSRFSLKIAPKTGLFLPEFVYVEEVDAVVSSDHSIEDTEKRLESA